MEKGIIISARHLKKVFGSGESEQVIYSDFDIDIYKGDFPSHPKASSYKFITILHQPLAFF